MVFSHGQPELTIGCRSLPCPTSSGGLGGVTAQSRPRSVVGTNPDPQLLCEGSFATPGGERGTHLPVPCGWRVGGGELASEAKTWSHLIDSMTAIGH